MDGADCRLDEDAAAVSLLVEQLESSSAWLRDAGFRKPTVNGLGDSPVQQWEVRLCPDRLDRRTATPTCIGEDAPSSDVLLGEYDLQTGILAFGLIDYFQVCAPAPTEENPDNQSCDWDATGTPTHELFHAIQGSYAYFKADEDDLWNWFDEGTATAVEAFRFGNWNLWSQAYWDYPLDDLRSNRDGERNDYLSYPFWGFLGYRLTPSEPVSYLAQVLPKLTNSKPQIESLDETLKSLESRGLWELLPDFHAVTAQSNIPLKTLFENPGTPIELIGQPGRNSEWHPSDGAVLRLASAYVEVQLVHLAQAEGVIEIRLEGDDDSALHLVVDDKNLSRIAPDRNLFRHRVTGPQTFEVRVVNVAADANRTRDQNYRLEARILTEHASMGRDGGGPSASDIDTPLPLNLDTVEPRTAIVAGPLQEHVQLGLQDVCMIQLIFTDSVTGDSLGLKADIIGPLLPGEYPVGAHGVLETADFPGAFSAGFGIGAGNAMGQGFEMGFRAVGGTVTIDEANPYFVEGRATLVGHNGKRTHCIAPSGEDAYFDPKGNQIACPGPRDMVVQARFGVIPAMTPGAERLGKSLEDCLVARPAPKTPEFPDPEPEPEPPWYLPGIFEIEDDMEFEEPPGGTLEEPPPSPEPVPEPPDLPPTPGEGVFADGDLVHLDSSDRWVVIQANGDLDARVVMEDPQFVGGCNGSSPLNFNFVQGQANDENLAQFGFKTTAVVATGETGTFDLHEIQWDFGTTAPKNMPASLNIRVPNRFKGQGSLELGTHTTTTTDRRMQGVVRGSGLQNRAGLRVDLEATFRVDWSCGVAPVQ